MMPALKSSLLDIMKEQPYAVVNDATSDPGLKKMNAVYCQIFDIIKSKRVEFQFYDMCAASGQLCWKARTLFEAIDGTLTKDGLDWDIVGVGLDNTNANIGKKNSIKSRIHEKKASCFIADCNCHLSHLAADRGDSAYSAVAGVDCQDHQVDLYYFFYGSTRPKDILTEYVEFVGLESENIVQYVQPR